MQSSVVIQNEMPLQILCTGTNFDETRTLNFRELSLFIERDIYTHVSRFEPTATEITVSLVEHDGLKQFRVKATVKDPVLIPCLQLDLENILWSYNQQILVQNAGKLRPSSSRFQFHVEVTSNEGRVDYV